MNYVKKYFAETSRIKEFDVWKAYHKLLIKTITYKITGVKTTQEKILGYKIYHNDIGNLFAMFTEIFVYEVYKAGQTKGLIVDCGSNIGISIFYFKRKHPEARIIGYEPDPDVFQLLTLNVRENNLKDVKVVGSGVSDRNGVETFYTYSDFANGVGNTFDEFYYGKEKRKKVVVPVTTIRYKPISILKLDVEGCERRILDDLYFNGILDDTSNVLMEFHYGSEENSLADCLVDLELSEFDYIINSDEIISPRVEKDFVDEFGRYVLIINAWRKKK